MKIRYDRDADALFVRFAETPIRETEEIRPGLMIDYDAEGRIVAMEVLRARETIGSDALAGIAAA